MKHHKYIFLITLILILCCATCGNHAKNITAISIGETFNSTKETSEGYLNYTINSVQYSDNVMDLGLNPEELANRSDFTGCYYVDGNLTSVENPIDTATGQLADHLLFVLADITVTNVNAISYEGNGSVFSLDSLKLCDTSADLGSKHDAYCCWSANVWYGAGEFDNQTAGTNGSNYFTLPQGEEMTYQLGFLIGNADNDFSNIYLTDGYGSYRKGAEATFVYLNIII